MRFRKKPVEIEAVQFNGSLESYRNIVDTLQIPENEIVFDSFNMEINIQTLEGIITAAPNDWVIKGIAGEFYLCKPDIFEMTYEEVDTDTQEKSELYIPDDTCPGCMKPKELCTMETTGCIGN